MSRRVRPGFPGGILSPLLLWLADAALLVGCIDLIVLTYVWCMSGTVFEHECFAANLEYADPYIGLTELYASAGKVNSSSVLSRSPSFPSRTAHPSS